jgi:tyrosinase
MPPELAPSTSNELRWQQYSLTPKQQQVYSMANSIAARFPDPTERQLYQQAASDFRIPYWDWATGPPPGQTHLPSVFWNPTMVQYGPNGAQTIRNPLYAYPFHPLDEDAMIWSPVYTFLSFQGSAATDSWLAQVLG